MNLLNFKFAEIKFRLFCCWDDLTWKSQDVKQGRMICLGWSSCLAWLSWVELPSAKLAECLSCRIGRVSSGLSDPITFRARVGSWVLSRDAKCSQVGCRVLLLMLPSPSWKVECQVGGGTESVELLSRCWMVASVESEWVTSKEHRFEREWYRGLHLT